MKQKTEILFHRAPLKRQTRFWQRGRTAKYFAKIHQWTRIRKIKQATEQIIVRTEGRRPYVEVSADSLIV